MNIALFIIGYYLIVEALIGNIGDDILSKIRFRVVPFFSGLFITFYSAVQMGWFN